MVVTGRIICASHGRTEVATTAPDMDDDVFGSPAVPVTGVPPRGVTNGPIGGPDCLIAANEPSLGERDTVVENGSFFYVPPAEGDGTEGVRALREAEVGLANGSTTGEVSRELGISEQTYRRCDVGLSAFPFRRRPNAGGTGVV